MTRNSSTRRRVLQGIGAGGAVAVLGTGSTVATQDENDTNDDDANDGNHDEYEEFAGVRFGHLSPDTPEVDVYLGKPPDLNPAIPGLAYPRFGPGPLDAYLQLPPGEYDATITPAGTMDPAIEVEGVEIEAGVRYTALAIGLLEAADDDSALQPLLLPDAMNTDEATPAEDEAEIRFVHASPDAGPVDILVDGEPLLEDVGFGDASDYVAVPPGDYDVAIESDGQEVLGVTRTLVGGTRITAHAVGLAGGEESDDQAEDAEERPLSVVASLDGTNPLAADVLMR